MAVNPVPDPESWDIPDAIRNHIVLLWKKKKLLGRPKKLRIPSAEEKRKLQSCSKCGKKGHNKSACLEPSSSTSKPAKKPRSCGICKKKGHNKLKCPNKPLEPTLTDTNEENAVGSAV